MSVNSMFPLQPFHFIFPGLSVSGLPMLITYGIDQEFIVINFDAYGDFQRYDEHPQPRRDYELTNSPNENDKREAAWLKTTLAQLGLVRLQPIRVQKFFIVKHLIGIRQYPHEYQRFLGESIEYSTDEIAALRQRWHELQAIGSPLILTCFRPEDYLNSSPEADEEDYAMFEAWREQGDFVFYCQTDYWCDEAGFVIAT
jgi:hypothetical protein